MCPVTGLPAKYREKETGIPFADARGWNIIRDLVKHRFVWSEEGGVYAGDDSEEKLEESGSVDDAVEEENSRPGRGRKGRGKQ